jgi:hypothetical protein
MAALSTTFSAFAVDPEPSSRASFPLVEQKAPPPQPAASAESAPTPAQSADTAPLPLPPSSPPRAQTDAPSLTRSPPAGQATSGNPEVDSQRKRDQQIHDEWMVSIEGATHAPIDAGIFGGIETPIGLRLFGGYGWVPSSYLNFITNAIVLSSGADSETSALVENGFEKGHAWRIQAGLRPFKNVGVYVDVGYSRLTLQGSLDTSELASVPELGLTGVYSLKTSIDMWLVELGYQAEIGGRVVLAAGIGMMGTLDAKTSVTADSSASAGVPSADTLESVDRQIEKHGYMPTLTLRLGFDLI